jgi:hypothetical protein
VSRAQTIFAVALSTITVLVLVVGLYVLSSSTWGDRWYRPLRSGHAGKNRKP